MALLVGDTGCTAGLSKRIYDAWTGAGASSGLSAPLTDAQKDTVRAIAYAVAQAVVDEIQSNGVVNVTTACSAGAGTGTGGVT